MHLPVQSPPEQSRKEGLLLRSPPTDSPAPTSSGVDELESHDSFDEIMTPNRVPRLERDYSSMSLLDATAQRPPSRRSGDYARRGSQLEARPAYARPPNPRASKQPSRLPTLQEPPTPIPTFPTTETATPTTRPQYRRARTTQTAQNPDPVSPLDADAWFNDASTFSPISPTISTTSTPAHSPASAPLDLFTHHLTALATQLRTHIALVRVASSRTAEQLAGPQRDAFESERKSSGSGTALQRAGSFGAFAEAGAGDGRAEGRRRIEEGRRRGWTRERFDPEKYRELAERALGEL